MKISRILLPIAFAILSLPPTPSAAAGQQLDIWTWRNPLPTGNQINCVTYGDNLFVGVGANGTIVTSSDGGATWNQQVVPANVSLAGVAYSSHLTLFVAVGTNAASDNVILTSPDGITWTPASHTGGFGTSGLNAVACDGNGDIMAVGNKGTTAYSLDGGTTWNLGTSGTTENLNAVTYGDNEFVAVGNGGSIFTTQNESSWTTQTSGATADFTGIAYDGKQQFVAVAFTGMFTSPDGAKWSSWTNNIGTAVTYGNGEFVVVNADTYYPGVLTSQDGTNWQTYTAYWIFGTITYGSGVFVAAGAGSGIAFNSRDVTIWAYWTNVVTGVTGSALNGITYGISTLGGSGPGVNLFVAGGGGYFGEPAIVTSPDGYAWTLDTDSSLSQPALYDTFITGMTYGSVTIGNSVFNFFVATLNAIAGYAPNVSGIIISSTDGIHWSSPDFKCANVLNGIAYGNGYFVAVGTDGTNAWSSDLGTWTPGTVAGVGGPLPAALNFNGVAYGVNGATPTFVAVGAGNAGYAGQVIYYSIDNGATWTAGSGPPSSELFHGVAYGKGMFVAVGSDDSGDGIIFTSTDGGVTFNQTTSFTFTPPTTAPPPFNGVTFANGLFVAVTTNRGNGGAIFVSKDGVHWTQSSIVTPGSLNAVASGDYQYIAVGDGGAILGGVLAVFPTGPGTFQRNLLTGCVSFEVMGPPGVTYGVYVSSDLINWAPLPGVTVNFNSSPIQWVQDCSGLPSAYYYLGPAP